MSDQNRKQGDPKTYPALAQMNTADLKRLLAQELDSLDDAEPDIAFLEAVTEVITKREAGTPEDRRADTAKAWQRLQHRLAEEAAAPDAEICVPPESKTQRHNARQGSRFLRILRSAAVIALIFLAACGTASAFGINVFQAMAQWTADTFRFVAGNHSSSVQADPYAELRAAVAERTDVAVVPNWVPDGTKVKEEIRIDEFSNGVRMQSVYESAAGGSFSIRICSYITSDFTGQYQKDAEKVQPYMAGGITHYIFSNNSKYGVAWTNGLVQVAIQGDLPEDDLKKMVNSIYEKER